MPNSLMTRFPSEHVSRLDIHEEIARVGSHLACNACGHDVGSDAPRRHHAVRELRQLAQSTRGSYRSEPCGIDGNERE